MSDGAPQASAQRDIRFEFLKFLRGDAKEILAARDAALLIHQGMDIDTAGSQIEHLVRAVLRRRLPTSAHVGHGHIVDSSWKQSSEFDVIIADAHGMPVLFRAEDGTEYFPYEAVLAIGEIKSTYYKRAGYIESFVDKIRFVKDTLCRPPATTARLYVGSQVNVNPLFTFMLFVNSGDFKLDQLEPLYKSAPVSHLPNWLTLLDRGSVFRAECARNGLGQLLPISIDTYPEFDWQPETPGRAMLWLLYRSSSDAILRRSGSEEERPGLTFGLLYETLITHIAQSSLVPPNMMTYLMDLHVGWEGEALT